jgi:DNA-binding NtrC family response regulator
MDGIEVLRRIQEEWPTIPVIIVTGFGTINGATFAIKLGAYDYIVKPFVPDRILTAVKNALSLKK